MTHLIPTQKDKNINTAELAPSLPLPWLVRLVVFGLNAVQPDFAIFCHFGNFRCIWRQFLCPKLPKISKMIVMDYGNKFGNFHQTGHSAQTKFLQIALIFF